MFQKAISALLVLLSRPIFFSSISVLIVLLILTGSIYVSYHHGIVGLVADDAIYLLMANYFTPYDNINFVSSEYVWKYTTFPPFYPLLLSIFNAGPNNVISAHLVTKLMGLSAIIAVFFWLKLQKTNRWISLVAALWFLVLPGTLMLNLDLWSEHLYLLLSMTMFITVIYAEKKPRFILLAGILIGLIIITRSIGIVLLLAFVIHLLRTKYPPKYTLLGLSFALLPLGVWHTIKSILKLDNETGYLDYVASQFIINPSSYLSWLLSDRLPSLASGFANYFSASHSSAILVAVILFLIMSTIGLIIRLRKLEIDAVYVTLYLGVIFLWPYTTHDERFLYPIIPILIFYNIVSISYFVRINPVSIYKNKVVTFFLLLSLIIVLPSLALVIQRINSPLVPENPSYLLTKRWISSPNLNREVANSMMIDGVINSFKLASAYIDPNECAYSVHQEMFMFYAKRLALPPAPTPTKDSDVQKRMQHCPFISVVWTNTNPLYPAGYPLRRMLALTSIAKFSVSKSDTRIISELYTNSAYLPAAK